MKERMIKEIKIKERQTEREREKKKKRERARDGGECLPPPWSAPKHLCREPEVLHTLQS